MERLKKILAAGGLCWGIGIGAPAIFAQDDAVDGTPPREHPLYGEAEPGPLPGDAGVPAALDMAEPARESMQMVGELTGMEVFPEDGMALGTVEDIVINLEEGRIELIWVRPQTDLAAPPGYQYAIHPEVVTLAEEGLRLALSEQEILEARVIPEDEFGGRMEALLNEAPVYRVGSLDTDAVAPYVEQEQTPIDQFMPRPPLYAEPGPVPDLGPSYPPEYRGGYPPEYREGRPPEQREDPRDGEVSPVFGGREEGAEEAPVYGEEFRGNHPVEP